MILYKAIKYLILDEALEVLFSNLYNNIILRRYQYKGNVFLDPGFIMRIDSIMSKASIQLNAYEMNLLYFLKNKDIIKE